MIKDGDTLISAPGAKFQGENPIPAFIEDLKKGSDYEERKKFVDTFNGANRYRKRGLCVLPMRYTQHYPNFNIRFPVFISVFHTDGTVAVSHGGK